MSEYFPIFYVFLLLIILLQTNIQHIIKGNIINVAFSEVSIHYNYSIKDITLALCVQDLNSSENKLRQNKKRIL